MKITNCFDLNRKKAETVIRFGPSLRTSLLKSNNENRPFREQTAHSVPCLFRFLPRWSQQSVRRTCTPS